MSVYVHNCKEDYVKYLLAVSTAFAVLVLGLFIWAPANQAQAQLSRPATGLSFMSALYVPLVPVRWHSLLPLTAPTGGDCGPGCVFTTQVRFPGAAAVRLIADTRGTGAVTLTAADLGDPIWVSSKEWTAFDTSVGAAWGLHNDIQVSVWLTTAEGETLEMNHPNLWIVPYP
jgi:hypothetical protein